LRVIRTHDLRHTYAILLIENGASLAYVEDQLGHSSIQTTVDVYGHLVPGANKHEVDKLDEILAENAPRDAPTKKRRAAGNPATP
jgi:integrase